MTDTVVILVNHLQGAGHLARAVNLGNAFCDAGYDAHIISGGFPVPQFNTSHVTLHQMPPIRADGHNFSRLLDETGAVADDAYHIKRSTFVVDVIRQVKPALLVVELFPFGRRNLKSEYLQALESVSRFDNPPQIFGSIRDILSPPSKPSKVDFAERVLTQYFKGVLIHAEQDVIALETSWPVSKVVRPLLHYTGFVAPGLPSVQTLDGKGEIVVATGSGDMGEQIIAATLQAADKVGKIRLLVGGSDLGRAEAVRTKAPGNVIVEWSRPDYREILQNADVSVSHCGYNTSMDLLQTGVPAVIVPYDEGAETEQKIRAEALCKLPGIERVFMDDLTGDTLLTAIQNARAAGRRAASDWRFDGAAETVRICEKWLH